jgi:phosphatidylinositol alpha-1,6-mannosyltransferase
VTFHGFTSLEKLDGLYRAASLFVLANRELPNGDSEGCPTVLLDASAYGLPTIAGHYGGTDDGVRQDETGLLVESKDHLRVGEALRGLLADEARRKTFGRNGRRFVRELSLGPALNSLQSELARVARAGEIQK